MYVFVQIIIRIRTNLLPHGLLKSLAKYHWSETIFPDVCSKIFCCWTIALRFMLKCLNQNPSPKSKYYYCYYYFIVVENTEVYEEPVVYCCMWRVLLYRHTLRGRCHSGIGLCVHTIANGCFLWVVSGITNSWDTQFFIDLKIVCGSWKRLVLNLNARH